VDLLAAAPKHERVPDLEPHHVLPFQDPLSAPAEDLALRLDRAPGQLPRNHQLPLDEVEDLLGDKTV